jgi:hypothetical protein
MDWNGTHFTTNITGSTLERWGTVTCNSATINVTGSSTLFIDKLDCKPDANGNGGTVHILCNSSSFVHIGELGCDVIVVHHGYASSMYIGNVFSCDTFDMDVHFSSRMDIVKGSITNVKGGVTHTSFVRNVASVRNLDVTVDGKFPAPHTDIFGSTYTNK